MENASKALIIAGSILIAIMVISLGVLIFRNMSEPVKENANLDAQIVSSFNADITPYLGKNISGSQVNALIQLVISIDNKALSNNDDKKRVSIYKDSNAIVKLESTDSSITYGNPRRVETGVYYNVKAEYDSNGLITKIVVETPN